MNRRYFPQGSLGLLVTPLAAAAQPFGKVPRVGYLFSFTPSSGQHLWEACRQGMHELGYVEGQNVLLEPRWADRHDQLPDLVADLLRLKVDVIVAAATPANIAAKSATSSVPIVMVAVAEPVRAGLVTSLARPGTNVTGLTLLTPELSGKRLELLADVLAGKLPRVAVLTNPANVSHTVFSEETRAAAQRTGTELQTLTAKATEDFEPAFEMAAKGRASALIVFDDPVLWSHRKHIVSLAARRRLPAMYGYREFADEGGLMPYGPSRPDLYRRTAIYVDKILKGANPAELPVERPTKFEFVINLKAARALGIAVPSTLRVRADQLIE